MKGNFFKHVTFWLFLDIIIAFVKTFVYPGYDVLYSDGSEACSLTDAAV
jgi:hypothetical protein